MNLSRGIFKVVPLYFNYLINYIVPFITMPILINNIGIVGYGFLGIIQANISYTSLLVNFSFDVTGVRRVSSLTNDIERAQAVIHLILAKCFLFLISLVLFSSFIVLYPLDEASKVAAMYAFGINFGFLMTNNWFYLSFNLSSRFVILNTFFKAVTYFLVIYLVKADSLYRYFIIFSVSQICFGVINIYDIYKVINPHINRLVFVDIKKEIKKIFKDDARIFLSNILTNVYTVSFISIIGLVTSREVVGIYSSISKIVIAINSFIFIPINQYFTPILSNKYSNKSVNRILLVSIVITAIFVLSMQLTASYSLPIFFARQYKIELLYLFRILIIIPFVLCFSNTFGALGLIATKNDKAYFRNILIVSISSIFLVTYLAYNFSFLGAGFAWLLTEILMSYLSYLSFKRIVK